MSSTIEAPQQATMYFDYQATTPVDTEVLNAMLPYFSVGFGNADSRHGHGQIAADAVTTAREQVAALLGAADPDEIVFSSGATESNAIALRTLLSDGRGSHLITSSIEHPSILRLASEFERQGGRVTLLRVDRYGQVDSAEVAAAIGPDTRLVSVMHANNEIGTVQPIAEIGQICRAAGVPLHSDMTQTAGILPIDVEKFGVDLASLSAHKFYGPKGVGALYIRESSGLRSQPGRREAGLRPGTLNVPGIVGLGRAALISRLRKDADATESTALRSAFFDDLSRSIPEAILNGHPQRRVPGNLSVSVPGVEMDEVLRRVPGLGLATGSACTAGRTEPSHVLTAIGLSRRLSRATLRIGFGRGTRSQDCSACLDTLVPLLIASRIKNLD
ncbi:cysteine desulfurase family protein [Actinoplanes sp. ATCC 53533]|uniref:cysteine desulfurase family protein n=1 Tax=Actinoplanes sp. ATCC 53533 TaxID=1288362 RepID=UPI0013159DAA|nr:cysteine desulfurase family protein [Actinoplanes sp. ATCC 53533]